MAESPNKLSNVEKWLESFPVEEVERQLHVLQAKAATIENEMRNLRRLLEARNRFLGIVDPEPDGQTRLRAGGPTADMTRYAVQRAHARNTAVARRATRSAAAKQSAAIRAASGSIAETVRVAADRQIPGRIVSGRAEALPEPDSSEHQEPAREEAPEVPQAQNPVSKADMLMYFLDRYRGETWKLSDIRDRLVADGVLEDSKPATHALQVTASRLARTRKLERPSPGHYRLPPGDNPEEDES